MEMKVYNTKSNAMRAAKKLTTSWSLDPVDGGWAITEYPDEAVTPADEFDPAEAPEFEEPKGRAPGSYTADELAVMGEAGVGEKDENGLGGVCPNCGIDHLDNGFAFDGDEVNGEKLGLTGGTWVCLACNGEWGPIPASFSTKFAGYKAAGNSKCKSLRLVALEYNGNRKNFIADAMECGVKEATAAANWACMKRGEI